MHGIIIATTRLDLNAPHGRSKLRWIGIFGSFDEMRVRTVGDEPRLVAEGAGVLARARRMGLKDGEVRQLAD